MEFTKLPESAPPGTAAPFTLGAERTGPIPLGDRTFTLYCDGKPVQTTAVGSQCVDGITVDVAFKTTIDALDGSDADPMIAAAWGGFRAGDRRFLQQKHPLQDKTFPDLGCVQLEEVLMPEEEGGEVRFRVTCLTPVFDWVGDKSLGGAGDIIDIPAVWFTGGHN